MIAKKLFDVTAEAVAAMLDPARPADRALGAFFREHRELGARDREFIAETGYAVLRRRGYLEHLTAAATPRLLAIGALLFVRGTSARELGDALRAKEAASLSTLKAQAAERSASLPRAAALDLPDWVLERLDGAHAPSEVEALARALAQPAPLDLRVNLLKTTRDAALAQLAADGIAAQPTPYAPNGIRLADKISLTHHRLLAEGAVEVQDEGSQLVTQLVGARRGEMVVDFCAGAGGKTLALAAAMRSAGRIYAFDVSVKRLDALKPRLARSGASNVHPQWIDGERDPRIGRLAGKIDRVLIDAPCSGLGTLRRNPDLKWRQGPEDVAELAAKQAAILDSAARLVKPGGRLVYVTCSILGDENEAIVDAFLARTPAFARLDAPALLAAQGIALPDAPGPDLVLTPHRHGTDGFYAAVLERRG